MAGITRQHFTAFEGSRPMPILPSGQERPVGLSAEGKAYVEGYAQGRAGLPPRTDRADPNERSAYFLGYRTGWHAEYQDKPWGRV